MSFNYLKIDCETQIRDGDVDLDHPGMDVMSSVFGNDKGGYVRGVGYGFTTGTYRNGCRTKGPSKERIEQLEFELQQEREVRLKSDAKHMEISKQLAETQEQFKTLVDQLSSQGMRLQLPYVAATSKTVNYDCFFYQMLASIANLLILFTNKFCS